MTAHRRRSTAPRTAWPLVVAAAALAACASPGLPPGGPERHTPPLITKIEPDTNAVNVRRREITFTFDEVISERPSAAGASTMSDLILISPRDGAPSVSSGRSEISARPEHGWRANTAYTVTLLPGVTDLRGNMRGLATQVTFSTGPTIPPTAITGHVFDAMTGLPTRDAFVEARSTGDTTLVYVGTTDTLGGFRMRGVAPAQYRVRAFVDQNRNRGLDPGEPFDTAAIALRDSATLELLPFVHDTAGPRLASVAPGSTPLALDATFSGPLDPAQALGPANFVLVGPDSAQVPIRGAHGVPETPPAGTPPASTRAAAPRSVVPIGREPGAVQGPPAGPAPRPHRPLLFRTVWLTLGAGLRPGATYRLRAVGIRGPTGKVATSETTFSAATAPAARDTARTRRP